MSQLRKLVRRGSTVGVVIPTPYMRELGWGPGDYIEFLVDTDALVLRNVRDCRVTVTAPSTRKRESDAAR